MKQFKDLTGHRFGRLEVLKYAGQSANKMFMFLCLCDCGILKTLRGNHLERGEIKSCGCFRREHSSAKIRAVSTTHGQCYSQTYESWVAMRARCTYQKHPAYHRYGGRGITVCDRWMNSFENFLEDMGERPPGKCIERRDNNGGYCKDNCRWATQKEQARNKRTNRHLSFNDETLTIGDWSDRLLFSKNTINERLKRGWSVERALSQPKVTYGKMELA